MSAALRRVLVAAVVAMLLVPAQSSAETEAQLKARLDAVSAKATRAGQRFSTAYWRLDETEVRLGKTRDKLKVTEKRLAAAKKRLNRRAGGIYRRGNVSYVEVILGAQSFEQLVTRLDYLTRVGSADAKVVSDVKTLRRRLRTQQRDLKAQRRTRAAEVARLKGERDRLQSRLASIQGEYAALKRRLDAVRSPGPRAPGVVSAPGGNGMVFPVAGPNYYADTWGASRSGGRRRHQGTDIMAAHGVPCVAVLDGTVSSKEGGLGGKTIWLTSNGWSFYYAHLQGWAVRSGRVKAGQVIGYVGSTGNATASAPHLHFQMHPGGGGAVNPYPYLRAME